MNGRDLWVHAAIGNLLRQRPDPTDEDCPRGVGTSTGRPRQKPGPKSLKPVVPEKFCPSCEGMVPVSEFRKKKRGDGLWVPRFECRLCENQRSSAAQKEKRAKRKEAAA